MHATKCMQLNARNCMQLHAFSCMQLQQQFTRRWGPRTPQWAVGVSLAYFLIQKKEVNKQTIKRRQTNANTLCMHPFACISLYASLCMHLLACICVHAYLCMHLCACISVHASLCMHLCACIFLHACR